MYANAQMTQQDLLTLKNLAGALRGLQTKAISGVPNAQLIYGIDPSGNAGIFGVMGMDDTVINAHMTPEGMDKMIPAFPTVYTNPLYPYITGFEADGDDEADGLCDDCPGGIIQTCVQTATFGRICRGSQEIEINNVMTKINRGETTNLRVLGQMLGDSQFISGATMDTPGWINYVTKTQMVITGVMLQRAFMPMLWQGNPANNSAGGGYKEFPGFDMLINTGKVDAISGATCEALDSDIKDFNYAAIDGGDPDIVNWLSSMMYSLSYIASRAHLEPVEWCICMRPQMFWELSAIWACRYLTHRCSDINANQVTVLNDTTSVHMRDAMRNGRYLTINGVNYPVVLDDGIYEEDSENSENVQPGEFASDIYVIPLRCRNIPVTYFEYLNYNAAAADIALLAGREDFWATDGGKFFWTLQQNTWCYKMQAKMEPRLVVLTPHLAGRITNVVVTPLQHLRSPWQDSPYFQKGGVASRTNPAANWYSPWNPPG